MCQSESLIFAAAEVAKNPSATAASIAVRRSGFVS